MKKLICAALLLFTAAAVFAADPVEGYWVSINEEGELTAGWHIYQKDGVLYGEILAAAGKPRDTIATAVKESYKDFPVSGTVNKMSLLGTPWIWGLTSKAEGQWTNGSIIDPADGKIYKCKITFRKADGKKYKEDTLEMRGEIGMGIGRSQFWKKSTPRRNRQNKVKRRSPQNPAYANAQAGSGENGKQYFQKV